MSDDAVDKFFDEMVSPILLSIIGNGVNMLMFR